MTIDELKINPKIIDNLKADYIVLDEFHCRGSFGPAHKGKPDAADLKAAQAFATTLIAKTK